MLRVDGNPVLINCVIWGNEQTELSFGSSCDPIVAYCNVRGGWAGLGNIDEDPLFAVATDCHLAAGSPCIDAGTNQPLLGSATLDDLDGNPRPLDGDGDAIAITDMGAYEFNPAVPSIALGPPEFRFVSIGGLADPAAQTLSLRNCGGGTLNWTITGQPSWLSVSPAMGASSGEVNEVTISPDISGLPPGEFTAELDVVDPQAVNSPRQISVTFVVGQVLDVPGEYPTIQAAIDAALDGDIVELAEGTYTGVGNKNLDFGGKAITVRSVSGNAALCVIDCERDGRGIYFHTGEGPDAVVAGVTIRGGYYNVGAGVYCRGASPTFRNCPPGYEFAPTQNRKCLPPRELRVKRCHVSDNLNPHDAHHPHDARENTHNFTAVLILA